MDLADFKTIPDPHQVVGTELICKEKTVALFDDMGLGKSKQFIDAACCLHRRNLIDTVVVAYPAQCRPVWVDPDFGQVAIHCWRPSVMTEYKAGVDLSYHLSQVGPGQLWWICVSYEFLRQEGKEGFPWVRYLAGVLKGRRRAMLGCDESLCLKNHKAKQTRAMYALRQVCQRAVVMDGLPQSQSTLDLYAQYAILDKDILGFKNFYHFRNHHAVMGGYMNKKVIRFEHLDEFHKKTAPYTLRRMKNLSRPAVHSVREARMSPSAWKIYKEMREACLAYVNDRASIAAHAVTKVLRLAQIASGFLGGFEDKHVEEIDDAKTRVYLDWVEEIRTLDPDARIITACRFQPEIQRLVRRLKERFEDGGLRCVFEFHGQASEEQRRQFDHAFQPTSARRWAVGVVQPQAGARGKNWHGANYVPFVSNDTNLATRRQMEDRIERRGQQQQTYYMDFLACGPDGQKTIDHLQLKALRNKEDMASWTLDRWKTEL